MKLAEEERAAKRARYSEALRNTEEIAPLHGTETVVQIPVRQAPHFSYNPRTAAGDEAYKRTKTWAYFNCSKPRQDSEAGPSNN